MRSCGVPLGLRSVVTMTAGSAFLRSHNDRTTGAYNLMLIR